MKILLLSLLFLGFAPVCQGTLRQRRTNAPIHAVDEYKQLSDTECDFMQTVATAACTSGITCFSAPAALYMFCRDSMTVEELRSYWTQFFEGNGGILFDSFCNLHDPRMLDSVFTMQNDPNLRDFVEMTLTCEAMICVGSCVCTFALLYGFCQRLSQPTIENSSQNERQRILQRCARELTAIIQQAQLRQIPLEEINVALQECIHAELSLPEAVHFLHEKLGLGQAAPATLSMK